MGQSKEIESRFRQHVSKLKNKRTSALKDFVDWYHDNGAQEELLKLVMLQDCDDVDFIKNSFESEFFYKLKPRFFGKKPSLLETWSHSLETREKLSLSSKDINTRLFLAKNKEIIKNMLLDDSITLDAIATSLSVTKSAIKNFNKENGLTQVYSAKSFYKTLEKIAEHRELIMQYAEDKTKSLRDLELILGIQHQYLSEYCRIEGIPLVKKGVILSEDHLSKIIKANTEKILCNTCPREISRNNYTRHSKTCDLYYCEDCGKLLSKKKAKRCGSCFRGVQGN